MKKLCLTVILLGLIWGCGEKGDPGPGATKEQITINDIKNEIDPSLELKKQQTQEVFKSLCSYNKETHSLVEQLSRQMKDQPVNGLHRKNETLNKAALIKLSAIKAYDNSEAKKWLAHYFEQLTSSLYIKVSADEKMYLAYLTAASTNGNSFINTLNKVIEVYSQQQVSLPSIEYLGKLTYFLTEVEGAYEVDKISLATKFINKFKSEATSSESLIYTHLLLFLNDPSETANINNDVMPMQRAHNINDAMKIKLSMALNTSLEEVKSCVEEYTRKTWQAYVPQAFYNDETSVLFAIEVLALQSLMQWQQKNLGYLVFLL